MIVFASRSMLPNPSGLGKRLTLHAHLSQRPLLQGVPETHFYAIRLRGFLLIIDNSAKVLIKTRIYESDHMALQRNSLSNEIERSSQLNFMGKNTSPGWAAPVQMPHGLLNDYSPKRQNL